MEHPAMIAKSIAGAIRIGRHADDLGQTSRQSAARAHHQQILSDNAEETVAMTWVLCAQAQIDQVHIVVAAPFERAKNHADVGAQPAVKDFYGVQLSVGRFFANRSGNRGAVPQPINRVWPFTGERDLDRAGDIAHVRMAGMNAAVNDRDLHRRKNDLTIVIAQSTKNALTTPIKKVYAAVTRRGESGKVYSPGEAVSIKDAVTMYTRNGVPASLSCRRLRVEPRSPRK